MVAPIAGDPRFFRSAGPFPLSVLADAIGFQLSGYPAERLFSGIAPLQTASSGQVSFFTNRKYLPVLHETRAGAVVLDLDMASEVPEGVIALPAKRPMTAWAQIASLFHPLEDVVPGRHPTAVIDPTAQVSPEAEIGAYCVVGPRAEIGAGCRVGPLVSIGAGVILGRGTRVASHVSISHSIIGDRVTIYPGARIGQDGFGFDPHPTARGFVSVPQLGRVIIEDDVEIGANSMIDRGSSQDTVIGAGSRLDNAVQIAHNVSIGRCCVLVSQVGISGSTTLGDYVTLAGQVGLIGHVHIGDRARVGAQAGVMADVEAGATVVGSPAEPVKDFFRQVAFVRRMMRREKAAKQ